VISIFQELTGIHRFPMGLYESRNFLIVLENVFVATYTTRPTRYRGEQTANILDMVMTNEETMIDGINY